MAHEIAPEVVVEIVESIFSSMLDLDVCSVDIPWCHAEDRLTSFVDLRGDWNGFVSVECNWLQACQFAGKFLAMDTPEAVDENVRDVLGELANMIGGNIKSVISADASLSTPSVIDGSKPTAGNGPSEPRDKIALRFAGGTFWITILSDDSGGAQ
jgi:chemotaxis protein CheX